MAGVAFILLVGVGSACHCHTSGQMRGGGPPPNECPEMSDETMDEAIEAARVRAERWVDPVEYEPGSLGFDPAYAVLSYPQADGSLGERSFTYDNALALLWFAWRGDRERAGGLAETLMYLQNEDGSWGFSFSTTNADDYHAQYVRSGTVAWAAHALSEYGHRYAQPRAIRAAERASHFLDRMRLPKNGPAQGLVSAGRGSPQTHPDAPPRTSLPYAVTEHQFDAQVVLERFDPMVADNLAGRMMRSLWIDDEGRFAVAAAKKRDTKRALDAAGAWGVLWLLGRDHQEKAHASFEYTEEHFRTRDGQLIGYRPYADPVEDYDVDRSEGHIFVEGTMSMGLAAWRIGNEERAEQILETGARLGCRGQPGLPYSNVERPDFSTRPAIASTIWFLFFEREMRTGQTAPLFTGETG